MYTYQRSLFIYFLFLFPATRDKARQARPGQARPDRAYLAYDLVLPNRSGASEEILSTSSGIVSGGSFDPSGFQSYSDLSATGRPYCSAKSPLLPCHDCHSLNGGIRMDLGVNLTVLTSLQSLHNPSFGYLSTFPFPALKRKPLPLSRGLPEPSTEGPCQNCRITF